MSGEPVVGLLEMIRQFGRERLAEDPDTQRAVVEAHAGWCTAVVAEASENFMGPNAATALDRLDRERDNIRAALEHDASAVLLERIENIADWWTNRGHWLEGRTILGRVLMRGVADDVIRGRVSLVCAGIAVRLGELDAARALVETALEIGRAHEQRDVEARALNVLGDVERITGNNERGEHLYSQSLAIATEIGDRKTIAVATGNLGVSTWREGRFAEARRWWTEALQISEALGDERGIAILKSNLGLLDIADGDLEGAEALIVDALATGQRLDDPLVTSQGLINLGELWRTWGDDARAREYYTAALDVYERVNDLPWVAAALMHLALVTDEMAEARAWLERALEVARRCNDARRIDEAEQLLVEVGKLEAEDASTAR